MLKGWKTLLFNGVAAAVAVADYTMQNAIVPEKYQGVAMGVVALGNAVLRLFTTTPVPFMRP